MSTIKVNNRSCVYPCHPQARGFTLIEIIVVVSIIGVMVAFLGVSMSRDTDRLARLEANRFQAIVTEVRDEAILTGENYLLVIERNTNSYHFEAVRAGHQTNFDDGLLRQRKLQVGVELSWQVFAQFDDDENVEPKVLISPLGEITPFTAEFAGDDNRYIVFIDEQSQLAQRIEKNNQFKG